MPPEPRGVLVTRPAAEARETARRIEARGLAPVIAPFMQISTTPPIALTDSVQAILVTSGNALPALCPGTLPVFAVGDSTAARALEAGHPIVHSASGDAAALSELVTARCDPAKGPLLLACGARQGAALAAALRTRGFRVIRRTAYTARSVGRFPAAARQAFENNALRAALFMSGETAAAFIRLFPAALRAHAETVDALAIGNRAADRLDALRWRSIRVARTPTLDDLLALL